MTGGSQTEKSRQRDGMAGLPSTADILDACRHGRWVPEPAVSRCSIESLDHLVGAQQERFRQLEAECLGDSEIDDQLELRRLLDRKLACLRAAQNLVHILARTPEQVRDVRPV